MLKQLPLFVTLATLLVSVANAAVTDTITSNGITWKLRAPAESGTFVTGDPWVVGPVEVISITNDKNSPDFTPRRGQNGSMVNPLAGGADRNKQGYDDALGNYDESLNAGLPNGMPVAADNPLLLPVNSTLISMTSWLYNDKNDAEPGTPRFNGGTKAPRPVTRSAGLLTVLPAAPPANAFRPAYAGADKAIQFTLADVNWSALKNLPAPSNTPNVPQLIDSIKRPWVDHAFEYLGAMVHPSEHMPNYGRDMGNLIVDASLAVNTSIPEAQKRELAMYLIQYGIDCTGIADNGGGWRANGGHALGRKWPILFSGIMLDNQHMKNVGQWDRTFGLGVEFQEDQNYFYVSQAEVELTNSSRWAPDHRNVKAGQAAPYTEADIGLPEWGIRHAYKPQSDNKSMGAVYRDINGGVAPGFALAALIMDGRELWNHEAFFDYCDRYFNHPERPTRGTNSLSPYVETMWNEYRADQGPVWTADQMAQHRM
ncbi:hypothetical protein [Cerasicoccus fimbriatus]|uniref:hypothetical protein n=1 Tax=Cerasicoccus fimbriatus TaxID=3014554 RepID=UPI0022B4ECDA|nr:hypothetical protein [Cerasicoccus sp. TK19100]